MKGKCLLIILLLSSLIACKDTVPVWRAVKNLPDFTLYLADFPCELDIDLSKVNSPSVNAKVELVVTYHKDIGRREIPLFITIEDNANRLSEHYTTVPIKDFDEWQGTPDAREELYTLSHIAIPSQEFSSAYYRFKIFADSPGEEKIYGITKIEVRLYQLDQGKE